jgi:fatty-acyl-CoA synthase
MSHDALWPRYTSPDDLAVIESVPLAERGLPASTYAVLEGAAALLPDRPSVTVLPEAARRRDPVRRNFGELLTDVTRMANLFFDLGVRRDTAVALISPNCDQLITATLAAQLAGIAALSTAVFGPTTSSGSSRLRAHGFWSLRRLNSTRTAGRWPNCESTKG